MELGADDYLYKPFEESELLRAIDSRLKRVEVFEQKAQLKTEAIYRMFLIVGFVLIGIIAFVVYRGYKQKKQANLEIS